MNILVMWSGGIDSTFVLARLLKESDHQIHAHHITLVNIEGRAFSEDRAIKALMPKLKALRPFTYSETLINHSRIPWYPYDMAIVCFEAGVVAKGFYKLPDRKPLDAWTIGTHKKEGHWQERWEVISKAFDAGFWDKDQPQLPEFRLQALVTKREEMDYLEQLGMLGDCWYCRVPMMWTPCGHCATCLEVQQARLAP